MGRRGAGTASDRLKFEAARELGFSDVIRKHGWEAATTKQVGLMVREMIKRGERELMREKQGRI